MRIALLTFYGIVFLSFSCTSGDNIRTYKLAKSDIPPVISTNQKQGVNASEGLTWDLPRTWVPTSGSSMRIASFNVPYLNEFGDLSVIKLGGSGGGIESNINRWRRQLSLEPFENDIGVANISISKTRGIFFFLSDFLPAFFSMFLIIFSKSIGIKLVSISITIL